MAQPITQLYDKMMKKILTLSSKAVINFINGLFDTHYDTDSQITYNWTEFEDYSLKRILADTILTINSTDSYHIEAQMYTDDAIILRVFEYGFSHALRNAVIHEDYCKIQFPNPAIIYLYYDGTVPDTYRLHVTFPDQQTITYTAPVLKLPDISAEELNKRKMVILIPFHLLKMRRLLEKSRSDANKEALKNILFHDILDSIKENMRLENITVSDAQMLLSYTLKLYHHLYSHYEEMEDINDMTDESFMTDADLIFKECEDRLNKAIAEHQAILAEREATIAEKEATIVQMDAYIAEKDASIAEKDASIAEKDASIAEKDASIAEKDASIAEKDASIAEKDASIAEKDASIAEKDATLAERDATLAERDATLAEKDALIASLQAQLDKFNKQ